MAKQCCPTCGQTLPIEYKHVLSKTLYQPLKMLSKAGGEANSNDLGLNYSQRANAQKLQYWKLITVDGRGVWRLTDLGKQFVNQEIALYKYVHTLDGKVVRYSGAKLAFSDIHDPAYTRQDYQEQARNSLK